MRTAKIALTILFLLSLFFPSRPVHADIAPPPAPGFGGLEPSNFQDTQVQMMFERVEMELKFVPNPNDSTSQNNQIDVTAWFVMRNRGNIDESMQAVFPLSDFNYCRFDHFVGLPTFANYMIREDSFDVAINGANVATKITTTSSDNKYCPGEGMMSWGAFDVTFPVGQDVLIRVNYSMESTGEDFVQAMEYILETGAAWNGPIQKGYIIFKFPYTVEHDSFLTGTTSGFQLQENEIYWSFEDLEPKEGNNIVVTFVSPKDWLDIRNWRETIKKEPSSPDAWLGLAGTYQAIASWGKGSVRENNYYAKIIPTYEKAIAANLNNSELYASYAQFIFGDCCYPSITTDRYNSSKPKIVDLLKKALSLDAGNETALQLISWIQSLDPNFAFTPPPTIPPTATSLYTATPSTTPTARLTTFPSVTPVVVTSIVTVIHTKIVEAPTSTPASSPTMVGSPTQIGSPVEEKSNATNFIFGGLVIFVVGIGAGIFLSNKIVK